MNLSKILKLAQELISDQSPYFWVILSNQTLVLPDTNLHGKFYDDPNKLLKDIAKEFPPETNPFFSASDVNHLSINLRNANNDWLTDPTTEDWNMFVRTTKGPVKVVIVKQFNRFQETDPRLSELGERVKKVVLDFNKYVNNRPDLFPIEIKALQEKNYISIYNILIDKAKYGNKDMEPLLLEHKKRFMSLEEFAVGWDESNLTHLINVSSETDDREL